MFIPITQPISPIPDLNIYDADENYEIPKSFDPVEHANRGNFIYFSH